MSRKHCSIGTMHNYSSYSLTETHKKATEHRVIHVVQLTEHKYACKTCKIQLTVTLVVAATWHPCYTWAQTNISNMSLANDTVSPRPVWMNRSVTKPNYVNRPR